MTRDERIAEGRIKHGVGDSENFAGNVSHLVSPVVGWLLLNQRDPEFLDADDKQWMIDRLRLVLDMAAQEHEGGSNA